MIITFFGHSHFCRTKEYEEKMLLFLENTVGNQAVDMFLGGYGEFDSFAYYCCKKYKETHSSVSLVFVTPYMTQEYQKKHLESQKFRYDLIIYPEIEKKPKKFAIAYRNRYMIEKSDFVVTYVSHDWGGAYTAYKMAKRIGKNVFNLAEFE